MTASVLLWQELLPRGQPVDLAPFATVMSAMPEGYEKQSPVCSNFITNELVNASNSSKERRCSSEIGSAVSLQRSRFPALGVQSAAPTGQIRLFLRVFPKNRRHHYNLQGYFLILYGHNCHKVI